MTVLIIIAAAAVVLVAAAAFFSAYAMLRKTLFRQPDHNGHALGEITHEDETDLIKERIKTYFSYKDAGLYEDVFIMSGDGLKLHGQLCRAEKPCGRAILCVHGYTGNGDCEYAPFARYFRERGFDILQIDLRAHGFSEGKYITFGVNDRLDVVRWVDLLREKTGYERIYLMGISMGSATVQMAIPLLDGKISGVIADCGFTSPAEEIRYVMQKVIKMPLFPIYYCCRILCRVVCGWSLCGASAEEAQRLNETVPVFFAHGANDKFVPPFMTERNYAACRAPKTIFRTNGEHIESYYLETDEYERRLDAFFTDMCGEKLA